ncbi:hypothetical protein ACO0SA_002761 [Hanseniaspora valbyensis]
MSEDNLNTATSNSKIIKQNIENQSIYKTNSSNSSNTSSKQKLNLDTAVPSPYKPSVKSPLQTPADSSTASNIDLNNIGKKKRDSLILSTSFVSARNRNGYMSPVDRSNSNNINNLRSNNGSLTAQSSAASLKDISLTGGEPLKNRPQSMIFSSSDSLNKNKSVNNVNLENPELRKPPSSGFLKNQFTPMSPLDSMKDSPSKQTSKDIKFKSRRNTINEPIKSSNMETNIGSSSFKPTLSPSQEFSKDKVIDFKAEREVLAAEKNLISKISKISRSLNKHYEQQNHYKKILDDIEKHIMMGSYTSDHINQYSTKLKASNSMHQNATVIKNMETELLALQKKLDELLLFKHDLNKRQESNESPDSHLFSFNNNNNNNNTINTVIHSNNANKNNNDSLPYIEEAFITPLQQIQPKFHSTTDMSPFSDVQSRFATSRRMTSTGSQLDIISSDAATEDATWEVSNCLQSLQERTNDHEFILNKSNRLIEVLKKNPKLKDELVSSAYLPAIQQMILNENKKIVASGYRVCRHLLIESTADIQSIQKVWERSKVEIALIKSLTNNTLSDSNMEKEQAIKLIRAVMEASRTVSLSIIQAVISSLEPSDANSIITNESASLDNLNKNDSIRDSTIELLLEMCYLAPMNIVQSKCNRLLESLIIGHKNYKLSKIIMETMLNLMTFHETRKHYLKYFSLQFLFEILTGIIDFSENQNLPTKLIEKCIVLLSFSLKSFTGLMIFATDNFKQIKELVRFLKVPSLIRYLVDLFLDVLNIKKLDYFDDDFHEKKNKTFKLLANNLDNELNVVIQYQSILARVLVDCNLSYFLKLALMSDTKKSTNSIKCKYLLSEFRKICGQLLFTETLNQNLDSQIPKNTFNFSQRKSSIVTGEENANNLLVNLVITYSQYVNMSYLLNEQKKTHNLDIVKDDSYRQLDSSMINNLDEASFKHLIDQTGVLQSKKYAEWNWGLLLFICKNLLNVNSRIDDLNKNTKFIRRLLVFYRPFRYRFSALKIENIKNGDLIIDVGCEFFRVLTKSEAGMKIFNEDLKFFPQIINCFYKLFENIFEQNVFSQNSLKFTLSSGYIKILANLTTTKQGVAMLNKWNIFSIVYKLFQFKGKEFQYILSLFIREFKLWESPHPLMILKKALVHHNHSIRNLATEMIGYHLGLLPKPELSVKIIALYTKDISNFDEKSHLLAIESLTQKQEIELLELLVEQLYDISPGVVASADRLLYTYSNNEYYDSSCISKHSFTRSINTVIPLVEPVIEQLIMINSPLLYSILTAPMGFKILDDIGHLNNERNKWLSFKNFEYVSLIEHMISDSLELKHNQTINNDTKEMPLHFYKSLSTTESGIRYIASKGDFVFFSNNIREFAVYIEDDVLYSTARINSLKSALWCVAFIGSSDLGIDMVESSHLIHDLIKISKFAKNVSIKFTCFFALGLISKTKTGCEIVNELGWDCSVDSRGEPNGVCLPLDINSFLTFPEALKKDGIWESLESITNNDMFLDEVFNNQNNTAGLTGYKSNESPSKINNALHDSVSFHHHNPNHTQNANSSNNKTITGLGVLPEESNIYPDESNYGTILEKDPNDLSINDDAKESSMSLVSKQPSVLEKKGNDTSRTGNEFYPDMSSSDTPSIVFSDDSFDASGLAEGTANNEDGNQLVVPVEKFKTEVVNGSKTLNEKGEDNKFSNKLNSEPPLPDMTLGIDLDNLLFMTRIIEDPTLLNDEDYETELKLKRQENMIQTLNEYGNKKTNPSFHSKNIFNSDMDGVVNNSNFSSIPEHYNQDDNSSDYFFQRIIQLVSQLNNHFLLNESRRELMKYYKTPKLNGYFTQPDIVNKVVDFMSIYKFSFQVRKFLCDLFLSNKSIEILMKKELIKTKYYDM